MSERSWSSLIDASVHCQYRTLFIYILSSLALILQTAAAQSRLALCIPNKALVSMVQLYSINCWFLGFSRSVNNPGQLPEPWHKLQATVWAFLFWFPVSNRSQTKFQHGSCKVVCHDQAVKNSLPDLYIFTSSQSCGWGWGT